LPKAGSGCFVGAAAVIALLVFGLLATLLSVVDDERVAVPGTYRVAVRSRCPWTLTAVTT
jgi:hypothetical protein